MVAINNDAQEWADSSTRSRESFQELHKKSRRGSLRIDAERCSAKKSVSFCKMVSIRAALHIDNYTEKEMRDTWYSADETARSQQHTKRLVKRLNRGEKLEENDECTARGLECRTKAGVLHRLRNRAKAKIVVCYEQERQWREEIRDPEAIAALYFAASNQSQIRAASQGLDDELAALPDFLKED